jgi:hypothetical protein
MRRTALLGATALCLFANSALAAEETIEVTGVAAVVNNDVAAARDKAIDDAKRKAVEQVAGAQISSQSMTENFQLVEERIYARASGFVRRYEIKSEFKDPDGTYHVKIKAAVDAGSVAENLDQIFKVKPRVIVLIAEQNVGASSMSYWWGQKGFSSEMDLMMNSLIGEWQPKGFKFVDPGMLKGKLKLTKAMQRAELGNDDVLTLGKNSDADIAIVGKVVVTDAGPVMEGVKMRSFHAVGTLRILNVDTGEILAVADEGATAAHIDGNQGGRLAIKALAKTLSPGLEKNILSKWTAEAASAQSLEVVLKGLKGSSELNRVTQYLKGEVRGVESVDVRRKRKGQVYLDVRYRGDGLGLGKAFEEKSFDGFKLDVDEASKAKLVLRVEK